MTSLKITNKSTFETLIWGQVSNQSLRTFKFLFGVLISFFAIRNIYYDFINSAYINCDFNWPIFSIITNHIPKNILPYFNGGCLVFGIQIARQKWGNIAYYGYLACFLPIFGFNYTYYQDHQLLIIIICSLLSLTAFNSKNGVTENWEVLMLKLLFSSILLWRGIAYLNPDWFSGATYSAIIDEKLHYPQISSTILSHNFTLFIIFALPIFEISSALLPWKFSKSLPLFWIGLLIYYSSNSLLDTKFEYSQMPLLLGLLSTVFLPTTYTESSLKKIKSVLSKLIQIGHTPPEKDQDKKGSQWIPILIWTYIAIQLIIPLNIYTIRKNFRWTITYPLFAWTMKLQATHKKGYYQIVNPATHAIIELIEAPRESMESDLTILRYAHQLRDHYKKEHNLTPDIYAHINRSIDSHPYVQWSNPSINLSVTDYQVTKSPSWIQPQPKDYFNQLQSQ